MDTEPPLLPDEFYYLILLSAICLHIIALFIMCWL